MDNPTTLQTAEVQRFYKDGVELEKGAILTEQRILEKESLYKKYCNYFSAYPDLFIDLITPKDSNFQLFFYQRIFLRACLRYRYFYCVAPRAFSKTFISILGMYLQCIFKPGSKCFICAPKKEQSAKIAKEKIEEILDLFPLLRKELIKDSYTAGSDYIKLVFRNGSVFDVVYAGDSTRGGRRHFGLVDEVRDHDADLLNEVVLPLLNVNRRTKARIVNPHENHQQQLYMTSAGDKNSYAYQRALAIFEDSIIQPQNAFFFGCDYRVPMLHGLLDKKYLNEIKMSSTYKDSSFSKEYLGKWIGGGNDSWFDFDRLSRHRKLLNPEKSQKVIKGSNFFYIISVDVGRVGTKNGCQTVVTITKNFIKESGIHSNLVNLFVLGLKEEDKHFSKQAVAIKKLIAAFEPKSVVLDLNGLGVGLMDYMVQPSYDGGDYYPGYCCVNNDDYRQSLYPDSIPLIYGIKAGNSSDSKIHSNCYSRIYSGKVTFLAKEQEVKNKLLSTKKGQSMSIEDRIKRLQPHELTTRLLEEMCNMKLKQTGTTDIKLEKINSKMLSDKFSSFEYNLWRVKEIEEEMQKKERRRSKSRKLVFYTAGGD